MLIYSKINMQTEVYKHSSKILNKYNQDNQDISQSLRKSYPNSPKSDIEWSAGLSGVADIQTAFNNARQTENSQLGTSVPMLTLPSQSQWDSMTDGEKALWLINRERIDRGVLPLHGLEKNTTSVAQYYAQYLIDNDAWGHEEDGKSPWDRLNSNSAINNCHDFLNVAENLAVFMTSGASIPLPIERSVFNWMYNDGTCCTWGHRHAILWYPYNDNSGTSGMEGFLGIGRASGHYSNWNFAEMIVMNIFDPCPTWKYEDSSSQDNQNKDLVNISGKVLLESTTLCGLVLANGQHMFSCAGNGSYNLTVPVDTNGEIILYGFCEGFQPFKQVLKPDKTATTTNYSYNIDINMQSA